MPINQTSDKPDTSLNNLDGQVVQETTTDPSNNPNNLIKSIKQKLPKLNPKKSLIALVVVLILLFLVVAATEVLKRTNGVNPIPVPAKPTLTPGETVIFDPSIYATDEQILTIEKSLNELEGKLTGIDLRESQLNPPSLDMNISFELD